MMRSLDRGLGRGAEPNLSRSARGPPVCMSSIAQQARPKSKYHTLLDRPQLSSQLTIWSTRVLMTLPPSSLYLSSTPVVGVVAMGLALLGDWPGGDGHRGNGDRRR